MAARREIVHLSPEQRLRDSPKQGTSMSLPLAIHQRLDVLTERAAAVAPSRAEIVGMLIAEADLNARELEQALMTYRKKSVGDTLPSMTHELDTGENVVQIRRRGPGRPRRNESA